MPYRPGRVKGRGGLGRGGSGSFKQTSIIREERSIVGLEVELCMTVGDVCRLGG